MNQCYISFINRLKSYYHIADDSAFSIEIIAKRLELEDVVKCKRFIDIMFFVLCIYGRNGVYDDCCEEMIHYLSSHYHPYSCLQKAFLHFLHPEYPFMNVSSLSSEWREFFHPSSSPSWVSVYHSLQSNNISSATDTLLLLFKKGLYQPVILYDLMLIADSSHFISLLPLFMQSLSSSYSLPDFPLLHPLSFPVSDSLNSFLIKTVLKKACQLHIPPSHLLPLIHQVHSTDEWIILLEVIVTSHLFQPIPSSLLNLLQLSTSPLLHTLLK